MVMVVIIMIHTPPVLAHNASQTLFPFLLAPVSTILIKSFYSDLQQGFPDRLSKTVISVISLTHYRNTCEAVYPRSVEVLIYIISGQPDVKFY